MIYLPTIPSRNIVEHKILLQQAVSPHHFTSTSNTQVNMLLGIPAQYVVVGAKVQLLEQLVGPLMSSLTVQIGTSSSSAYYVPSFQLMQIATATTFQLSTNAFREATVAAHDIVATFTSVGTTINNITSGALEITIQYRPV